ncbi:MAG: type IV secretion system protein, partial [Caulobacteraceae bacterium]|nr:type IV secretion system protein [Caulobacter sp.]
MADACPVPGPDDPLVQGLLATTDCHVEGLVRGGYASLFEGAGGAFGGVLTALLTVWVALLGYRLLLGRSQLSVSEFAVSAVKLGAVVALATQWGTYQAVVYRVLFDGPQEVAGALMHGLSAHGAAGGGDVFDGLQRAFDDLTAFSPAAPPGAPAAPAAPAISPALAAAAPTAASLPQTPAGGGLLGKGGFDALLLLFSAVALLLSTLGVLLMAKVVLGLLLALGPIFIACLLFDSTRGVFEGWLRASLGFAFAPLATTVLLGLSLTLLGPYLDQIETMRDQHVYTPGVAFAVTVLVLVFAAVAGGMLLAAGVVAGGFRLPALRRAAAARADAAVAPPQMEPAALGRAERAANAVAAQAVRDQTVLARGSGAGGATTA